MNDWKDYDSNWWWQWPVCVIGVCIGLTLFGQAGGCSITLTDPVVVEKETRDT